jgi:Uroporphyrinogen-III methylase
VTDREFASSVGFYSMHKKEGTLLSEQEWQRMAQGPDTLVLLMGSTVLAEIAEN